MTHERARFQFPLRTIFVFTTILAIVLAAYLALDRAADQFLLGETGPVESRDDWPTPLKAILAEAKEGDLDESAIQVYCLGHVFDREYVWRMDAAPGLLEQLKQRWKLAQVSHPAWPVVGRQHYTRNSASPSSA